MSIYLILLISPFIIQAGMIFFDEFYFHHRRGLPLWERIGHPLDTITILMCYAFVMTSPASVKNVGIYIALALFSSLFITKDEFVHNEECPAIEQWLHSVLFIIHPIVLMALGFYWFNPNSFNFLTIQEYQFFRKFITGQFILILIFLTYQILYWNIPGNFFSNNHQLTKKT